MSNNPYQAPAAQPFGGGPNNQYAASKVKGPALGLMISMAISLVLVVIGLVMNLLGVSMGAAAASNTNMAENPEFLANMIGGTVGIVSGVLGLLIGGLIMFGSYKMMNLQSYGLSMTTAILAMIPCISPCCLLGIPFGIWAIVALNDPQVKASFR